ncbi:tetratricopeptide repeat protein [uncultured Gimesia sp.]|uniref:tetratricopeptide repeat protein n=1 Tax=uncultured Gimesia sp. TaxID=1678688 RepID=UPI0030DD1730|tara:strand:- start:22235 stop:23533 length:1299 start_codon:yes stop_codon:yes gene_type:complete
MKRQERKSRNQLEADSIESPSENDIQTPARTVSLVTAGVLTCGVAWWIQRVRAEGGLSLPYVRLDIMVVSFLCMLPLAMLLVEAMFAVLKRRNRFIFLTVQFVLFIGTAGLFFLAFTSDQASVTLSQDDAWEFFLLRPVIAFWIMVSSLLLVGNLFPFQESASMPRQGALVWLLVGITALVVPAFYVQSRVDEMVTKTEENLGSGRLGDARQGVREICVLSPWEEIGGASVRDLARDLDRDCYEIERNLAFMARRPVQSEEFTYQRARLLSILGQRSAAARLLKTWTGKPGASPLSYQLLGNIYQQQENWGESERYYRRALKAWETLPRSEQQQAGIVAAWKGMAFAERKRGNYAEAEAAYLSALSLVPTADQHFLLAQFYEDTQQTTKARDHVQQAMALNASRYAIPGKKLITSLQQQHFGCLNVWRNGRP